MDNTFVIKNKIMQTFETGNILLDLILGTFICSIITGLLSLINLSDLMRG